MNYARFYYFSGVWRALFHIRIFWVPQYRWLTVTFE